MTGMRFAVIGTGAGGCATAAALCKAGHDVTMYGRHEDRRRAVERHGGLTLIENEQRWRTTSVHFTSDIAAAVKSASHVLVVVPTSAIISYGRAMAPFLAEGTRVLLAPGHTGGALAFRNAVESTMPGAGARIGIAETCTLPFVARMTADAEVTVWRRTNNLLTGVLPAQAGSDIVAQFSAVFPAMRAVEDVLTSSLSNLNAVMHPPGMIGNTGWVESTAGGFRFYSEGVTDGIGAMMRGIDGERTAIADAYGRPVLGFLEQFEAAGLVDHAAAAAGDFAAAVRSSGPNALIKAPSSLRDRYVVEDVGCGLVAMAALGDAAGVHTPVIDSLIVLAGVVNGVDYFAAGLNAQRLGIAGLNPDQIIELVQ